MSMTRLLEAAEASPLRACLLILLTLVAYKAAQALYRVYLHPLSRFPGPREAPPPGYRSYRAPGCRSKNSSGCMRDLVHLDSSNTAVKPANIGIGTHALRIGPNELHLGDVTKYKTIYNQSRPFPKQGSFYEGFGTPHTVFVETDFTLHKARRRLLNPFFARSGILKLEPRLQKHIEALRSKLCELSERGQSIVAQNAFRCVTVDIISEFAFAKSRLLVDNSNDRFAADFLKTFDAASDLLWGSIFNPFGRQAGAMLPKTLVTALSTPLRRLFALTDEGAASLKVYQSAIPESDGRVIFDGLQHLSDDLVAAEAVDILVAGSDTTAFTLISGVWHICHNPSIKRKLTEALEQALPEQGDTYPTFLQLESIPYLMACVKKSLRVAMPVPGRLPRVVPSGSPTPLIVDDKAVPPDTVVGMSAYTMHSSPDVWGADARCFKPERWIGEAGKGLDERLVTFYKGARNCVGQNLAQAELLLMLYMLYRNFDIELDSSCAEGFATKDNFTQSVQEPGVLLRMCQRS